MAGKSTDFLFRILADSNQGVAELDKFSSKLDATGSAGSASLGKIGAIAGFVGGAVAELTRRTIDALGTYVGEAAAASDSTDKFRNTLNFANVDGGTIDALAKSTRKYADETVYDLATIQNTTAQLAANSVPNYEALTEAAGNLNAVAGGNADTFRSVSLVVTQTAGAGKLTTENWNQLADAIPGASGKIQDALRKNGAFTGNFRDAMEKGKISSDEFNAALLELGSQPIAVEAAKSTATLEGALGNLQASLVGGLGDWINKVKPMLTGGITWASNVIGGFFSWTMTAVDGLVAFVGRGDFTAAFRQAFNVDEDSGIVDGLFTVRDAVIRIGQVGAATWGAFAAAAAPVLPILQSLVPQLVQLWESVSPVSIIFQILGPQLPALATSFGELTVNIAQLASGALSVVLPLLSQLVTWLVDVLTWAAQNRDIVLAVGVAWLTWKAIAGVLALVKSAQLGYTAATYGAAAATYVSEAATKAQVIAARAGATALALQNSAVYRSIAGWVANTAAVATNNTLTLSTRAAIIASSVATGIATAAQWAWNAALTANPIGIIVMAIAALVGALIWFFTQTDLGKAVWQGLVDGISAAVTWLWESVLQPVFSWIGDLFTWIYTYVIQPIVLGIQLYIGIWAAVLTWLWQSVIQPIITGAGVIFRWLYENAIKPVVDLITLSLQGWGIIFDWLWQNVLKPTIDFISLAIQGLGIIFDWLWRTVLQPTFAAIGLGFSILWTNTVKPVVDWISGALRGLGEIATNVFNGIGSFAGSIFRSLLDSAKAPLNGIIDLINGLIGALNAIQIKIPDGIPNWGGKTIGFNIRSIPHLATGGITTAPMLALIGDNPGGREVVEPLESYQANMQQAFAAGAAQSSSTSDRPIYADGIGLIGWFREIAGQEAQLVWATADSSRTTTTRMGRQRGV